VDPATRFAVARALMAKSDCAMCHNRDTKSRGPSFVQLAEKYKPEPETLTALATKIRSGGSGVWGPEVMPAHPLITMHEATTMAEYMVSVKETRLSSLPLQGTYTPAIPAGDNGRGSLVVRAVYSDKGAGDLPVLTSEAVTVLRTPRLGPAHADIQHGVTAAPARGSSGAVIPRADSHIAYRQVDLTGITRAEIAAQASARNDNVGGTIEVRTGSPTGALLGQAAVNVPGAGGSGSTAGDAQTAGTGAAGGGRGGRGGRTGVEIALKPATGVHDLYFVFKNAKATPIQPLMTVSTITLQAGQ
jgi:cytochrome c